MPKPRKYFSSAEKDVFVGKEELETQFENEVLRHADLDYDVTTGARFHTLEIILSMLIKFATILLLGPPVVAVIVFVEQPLQTD